MRGKEEGRRSDGGKMEEVNQEGIGKGGEEGRNRNRRVND